MKNLTINADFWQAEMLKKCVAKNWIAQYFNFGRYPLQP